MSAGRILLDDVGAGDIRGHQIGGELDAAELQSEGSGDGADHEGLRGARQAGDEAVPADEQGNQDLLQHLLLADDHLANLVQDPIPNGMEPLHSQLQLVRVHLGDRYGAHAKDL